jgi:hypothetical protein
MQRNYINFVMLCIIACHAFLHTMEPQPTSPCNPFKAKICLIASTACGGVSLVIGGIVLSNPYLLISGAGALGADVLYILCKSYPTYSSSNLCIRCGSDSEIYQRPPNYYRAESKSSNEDSDSSSYEEL